MRETEMAPPPAAAPPAAAAVSTAAPEPEPESDPRGAHVESTGVGLVRRRLVRTLLGVSPVAMALACALAAATWLTPFGPLAAIVTLAAAVAAPLVAGLLALIDRAGLKQPGHLAIGHGRLVVRRARGHAPELSVPLADLTAGVYVPTAHHPVEFTRRSGDRVVARVADAAEAERVLLAAGLAASQRAVTLPLRGMIGTPVRVLLAVILSAVPTLVAPLTVLRSAPDGAAIATVLWLLTQVAVGVATARWFGSPRLVVGADGLALEHALRRRFIPYGQVAHVERQEWTVDRHVHSRLNVHLTGGETVRLPTIGQSTDTVATTIERIRTAMRAHERRGDAAATGDAALAMIERNGRTLADWKRDLAALLRAPESYRRVHLSPDELRAAVEDPRVPVARRLAAAVALAVLGDDDAPARIRVAAEASASEPLRVALERAARDELDDATIERALAAERHAAR